VVDAVAALDLPVALNAPYAGAYGLERHGRPGQAIHALQVEVDRSLYLMPDLRSPSAGLERARAAVAAAGRAALGALQPRPALAAE
jgi:N-formylglutamate amidohydrolase